MDVPTTPIDDVSRSTGAYIREHYMVQAVICVIIIILTIFGVARGLPPQIAFFAVFLVAAGYSYVYSKIKSEFVKQFGESIGFTYMPAGDMSMVSGKLFSVGHSQSIKDVLIGSYQNIPLKIFTYSYTVGSGKNQQTFTFTVFAADLPNPVPEIILNSKIESQVVGYGEAHFSLFDPSTHVELEGDFNKYFSLSVPKGFEQEAYEIFTPDVMADLIDRASKFDFEFSGSRLYIYTHNMLTTRVGMQSAFDMVDFLVPLFVHNTIGVEATHPVV